MRIIKKNMKLGEMTLACDSKEDLWYLSTIIDEGDSVAARTVRKVKATEEGDAIKIPVFAIIKADECELTGDELRVAGIIIGGSEELTRGSHHSIKLRLHEEITIRKEWLRHQLEKVDEACAGGPAQVLIVVHDREEAFIAKMTRTGYDILVHLEGEPIKKDNPSGKDFYLEIKKVLEQYDERYKPTRIILASPAFFKEDLAKALSKEMKSRLIYATIGSVGKNGIDETLKRDETKTALLAHKSADELRIVEELLKEISKDGNYAYGIRQTKTAIESGAVKILLVCERLIKEKRAAKKYIEIDTMMKDVDRMEGDIRIISEDNDGGRKLWGLGGIGAILRYKLN